MENSSGGKQRAQFSSHVGDAKSTPGTAVDDDIVEIYDRAMGYESSSGANSINARSTSSVSSNATSYGNPADPNEYCEPYEVQVLGGAKSPQPPGALSYAVDVVDDDFSVYVEGADVRVPQQPDG